MRLLSNCCDSAKLRCKRACPIVLLVALLFCGAVPAEAQTLTLKLTPSGGPTLTIPDNGPGDIDLAVGAVAYNGAIGNFTLAAISGSTLRSDSGASVHFAGFVRTGAADTLTMELSDTDFPQVRETRRYEFVRWKHPRTHRSSKLR